ncbi:PREDICTED: fibroin heavy chain-like [Calidris pugnax]|uniref:fibroin heavy chain-like n=1 Tax=Calidris pugnax TaxID=198806 RepID=UPI00071C23E6|nr:PREDICTED: fibroin heavy chain-like [Calidris pugnax]
MGTRGWTLSTFVGCCLWILQGLRAAAAVPVTTEGPFTAGTASPITAESEVPSALLLGTVETNTAAMSTTAADAEIDESILMGNSSSPPFSPGAELATLGTAASQSNSTVPPLTNMTEPLSVSQDNERGAAALAAAMTADTTVSQDPAVTSDVELDVTGTTPNVPLGTTPLFADMKEDILAAVTREGAEDRDLTAGATFLPTTPPPAASWGAQPSAGSPVGASVTVLHSQGLTTAMGAVEEGVSLPVGIQSEASANSFSPRSGAGGLLTTQQDGAVSGAVGITPEPAEETAPATEESPLASEPRDAGDAVNGAFSMAGSSHLPPASPTVWGTLGNPGEPPLLPDQASLSPTAWLAPVSGGDWDGQGAPSMSLGAPGSSGLLAASEAPAVTEDMGISLLVPSVPADVQSDTNPLAQATELPTEDMGAAGLAESSLQPAPWQSPGGEQPPLLAATLPYPMDTSSAPGAAYPPPGAGTLSAADGGVETPGSPDFGAVPGAPMSPSLGGSQPWDTEAGAPQGADGAGTGLNSPLDASNPVSFVPDGLAGPTAGVLVQGAEGADMAQAGGPGNGSPYSDTPAFSTQQDPTSMGELPAGGTGALVNAELSPSSALGEQAGAGAALGEVSLPGPAFPSSTGLESNLSGAEGPENLPGEFLSAPGAAYPPPGAVPVPVSGAETPVNPDLGAAQGAPMFPSLGGSQSWGTAAGAPQGAGLPEANVPGSGLTSAWDASSSAAYGPAEPPSPGLGVQPGTNVGLPAAEGHGSGTVEQALGGAESGTGFEPSLISTAGGGTAAGMDQLPGAVSSSGPASPSGVVAAPSVSEGDGTGSIPAAAPGPDSLSLASPDSETGPELSLVQGAASTGDVAQTGNPEETGALVNAELSPSSALGEQAGAGAALGEASLPGPAFPSSTGLESNLSGAEGPENLPGEFLSAPGAAYPPPGAVPVPVSGAETPVNPDLGAAQGAPMFPSLGGSQSWGTAAGAPQGAGLPEANEKGQVKQVVTERPWEKGQVKQVVTERPWVSPRLLLERDRLVQEPLMEKLEPFCSLHLLPHLQRDLHHLERPVRLAMEQAFLELVEPAVA